MRKMNAEMTARWKAQAKTGDQRPVVRATVQKANMPLFPYDIPLANGRHRKGTFASLIFGDPSPVIEIPNIKNYTWTRSVDQDVATCTITLLNTDVTPIGVEQPRAEDFEDPGYLTFNRGEQGVSVDRWGYDAALANRPNRNNGWQGLLMPDRMVKTYEGYGCDPSVAPALDANLVQSGTWLIDKVSYGADGTISIEMRDVGRMLLDQMVFPPTIPFAEYPLAWHATRSINVGGRKVAGGSWGIPKGDPRSSNNLYIGAGLTDPPYDSYVDADGGVNGHYASHALTLGDKTYWLSTGQSTRTSKVWWQIDLDNPKSIAAVRINPFYGSGKVYVSVKTSKGWAGRKKVPYDVTTGGVDIKADIPFVTSKVFDQHEDRFEIVLPHKYRNVVAVRLTFAQLDNTRVGKYPWRGALSSVELYSGAYDSLSITKDTRVRDYSNYSDYTEIVKWICAWGGFFWPGHKTEEWHGHINKDYVQTSTGLDGRRYISYASPDPVLPKGRVWGDFMNSGTKGDADLTVDLFDKHPLMDVINYVRDVLGFIFFIDETGAVVWRMPNWWKLGNYLSPGQLAARTRARTTDYITLDENETLLDYTTTLSGENSRDRIFIANVTGKVGVVIKGFQPTFIKHGFRRQAGWTDQHFKNNRECRVMADLVASQQVFDFRRGKARIPGYPAIQVDDQVRIFERVTNETFFHYVLGVTSTLDMEAGTWFYDVDTHWLGDNPDGKWIVRQDKLDWATHVYLNQLQ